MASWESNGHVTDDVTWSCLVPIISKTAGDRGLAVTLLQTDSTPLGRPKSTKVDLLDSTRGSSYKSLDTTDVR